MSEEKPQVLEHALSLHQQNLVADAHFDLLSMVLPRRRAGRTHVIETDFLPRMKKGNVGLLICSLYVDSAYIPEMALRIALDQIACLNEEIAESPNELALCRNTKEIEKAHAAGKIALLLSFEGVEPLGNDLMLLRDFYELGVRGVGLTWSRRNYAADGCHFHPTPEGIRGGLTDFGVRLLAEIERLGMYVDVSHLNDEGFRDVVQLTKRPFIASHSNCRSLTNTMRNLTDEMIRTVAKRGGIMGMNCCSSFVDLGQGASEAALAVHGAHVKQLVGADHLCFGFDFCDELHSVSGTKNISSSCDCVHFYDGMPVLTQQLISQGFNDEELKGVLGGNMMKFLRSTIG